MHPHPPAQAPVLLRPMDVGEVLDTSFKVFRHAWRPMLLISLINAVPIALFTGFFQSFLQVDTSSPEQSFLFQAITGAETGDWTGLASIVLVYVGYILIYTLLVPLVNGALMTAIWDVVLGGTPEAGNVLRRAARRYLALLGTSLLKALFAILPLLLLFVAALPAVTSLPQLQRGVLIALLVLAVISGEIALFMYTGFTTQTVVLERAGGGFAAMRRSFRLISGRFWPLLGLAVVFFMMTSVISGLISAIFGIPVGFAAVAAGDLGGVAWLQALSTGLGQLIVMPLLLIGHTLAYFDTRVRKEGLDLELLALAQRQGAVPPS